MFCKNIIRRIFVLAALSMLIFSVNAVQAKSEAMFSKYLAYLEKMDGGAEHRNLNGLKQSLKNYYAGENIQVTSPTESHKFFKRNKDDLISQWEKEYGMYWPKYSKDIGNRKQGDRYDAHHIIPQSYNGPNEWWNLMPLTELQHTHIHKESECAELFPKAKGGREKHRT